MTDYQKYINTLRKCAKEHENDRTFTGHIIVSDLCKDTANLLEELEQQSCEDAVSRAEVIDELNRLGRNAFKDDTDYDNFFAFVDSLPQVTPTKCIATVKFSKEDMQELVNEKMKDIVVERKKGKWIPRKAKYDNAVPVYECSICHKNNGFDDDNFCPNCGAEMEGEE